MLYRQIPLPPIETGLRQSLMLGCGQRSACIARRVVGPSGALLLGGEGSFFVEEARTLLDVAFNKRFQAHFPTEALYAWYRLRRAGIPRLGLDSPNAGNPVLLVIEGGTHYR